MSSMTGISLSYCDMDNCNVWVGHNLVIDSVVLVQYINVTDRQTDSHVAMANSMP